MDLNYLRNFWYWHDMLNLFDVLLLSNFFVVAIIYFSGFLDLFNMFDFFDVIVFRNWIMMFLLMLFQNILHFS